MADLEDELENPELVKELEAAEIEPVLSKSQLKKQKRNQKKQAASAISNMSDEEEEEEAEEKPEPTPEPSPKVQKKAGKKGKKGKPSFAAMQMSDEDEEDEQEQIQASQQLRSPCHMVDVSHFWSKIDLVKKNFDENFLSKMYVRRRIFDQTNFRPKNRCLLCVYNSKL